ncbi:ABC transporter permease [Bacillus sp. FJAT-49705]|uniref:ABC transporter permease n=1 Tax=Cytobacillus citreus TaxID=2833586 RepID=A0ABS5NXR9_9BACI|nr:ABC transporter permease [Cytobacillus citreus]MBS4191689.1 ABC transporter permease [Cytobacillus citreus]
MNSRKIFMNRLIRAWKYQYGVIRSIADWTIILYLIIPSAAIFIMMYRTWWQETPAWIEFLPFSLIFFSIYLFSWSGRIRTYVQEADKVFLIKNGPIFIGMKKWGYAYSLLVQFFSTGVSILILLPFLRNHYLLDWQKIITLFFYFFSLKTTILLVKFYLRRIEIKFKKIAAGILLFIVFSLFSQLIYLLWEKDLFIFIYICGAILMAASVFQSLKALKKISSIDHEIAMGLEDKMKHINIIFSLSYDIEKPAVSKRTKPLLFRRSKRIFKKRTKVNGHTELFIKIFIRNYSYIFGFIQIISVTTAAMIIIPPLWIKATIFIGFLIMMHFWLSLIWDKITASNPISNKYREMPSYFSARKRAVTTLFIAAILILSLFITGWFLLLSYFGVSIGMLGR